MPAAFRPRAPPSCSCPPCRIPQWIGVRAVTPRVSGSHCSCFRLRLAGPGWRSSVGNFTGRRLGGRPGSSGDPFGPGSPLISSLAGARAETAAIPVAFARWRGLRASLANAADRSGDRFRGRADREADGVRAGGGIWPTTCCPIVPHGHAPATPSGSSAPLRPGREALVSRILSSYQTSSLAPSAFALRQNLLTDARISSADLTHL